MRDTLAMWARELRGLDRPLIGAVALLLALGLISLYSASFQKAQALGVSFLTRQAMWIALGSLLGVFLFRVDYHRWLELSYLLYALNLALLVWVLAAGEVRGGAQRWLTIGGLTIQPSELSKLTLVLVLARFLGSRPLPFVGYASSRPDARSGWTALGFTLLVLLPPMILIFKEPNLGTALVLLPVALAMLWVWGIPGKILLFFLGFLAAGIPFFFSHLADYQRARLMVFLNPDLDPLGAGYTVIQSRIAIGSGGFIGKGWMAGTQNQLNFLPERHTDFIFSVIGEEWGFLGSAIFLSVFAFLIYRGLRIVEQTRDPFGRLLVAGLTAMFFTHLIVNVGMSMGLMPVVGIPLPFVSYGGSWMLTSLAAIGMLLSVKKGTLHLGTH